MGLNLKWMKAGLALAIAGCALSAQAADIAPPVADAQAPAAAAQSPEELAKLVEKQNRQIDLLMQRLDQLEKKQAADAQKQAEDTAQVKKVVMETNSAVAETNKKVEATDGKLVLGKGIDGLKLSGDLRARYEGRDRSFAKGNPVDDGDRARIRTRFRLGGVWTNKTEDWEVGAGVATGNDSNGRSTNADYGTATNGAYDHLSLWLDYAYAKHKWNADGVPMSLTIGQQKNPFIATILNSDSDLRPQGLTLQYGDPLDKEYSGAFLTGGVYMIQYLSTGQVIGGDSQSQIGNNVYSLQVQGGYKYKGENGEWLGALGYQKVTNAYRNSTGNLWKYSQNPNNPFGVGKDTGYGYDVFDAYAEYKTTVNGIELKPYGHVCYNLGADGKKSQQKDSSTNTSTENLGWMVGIEARKGKWTFGYGYAYIGAECVFGPLRDSDFGETGGMMDTDLQGHVFRLGYDVSKNFNIGASLMLMNRINGGSVNGGANPDRANLIQIDAVYKF